MKQFQSSEGFSGNEFKKEVDIQRILKTIKKNFWIIIVITTIFASISGIYSYLTFNPLYHSSARILVKADSELMKTLTVMMREPIVLEKVVSDLKLNQSPESLSKQISVQNIEGSQVVTINVVDSNPGSPPKIANATAEAYKSEIPKLLDFEDFEILSTAQYAVAINDNYIRNIVGAFIVGLIISIGLIFLLDSMDSTIKTEREIEELLGVPVIGTISKVNKRTIQKNRSQKNMSLRGESLGSQ